jgi:hypothetical protein
MADTIEEYNADLRKVVRTLTVDFLKGGGFNVKENGNEAVLLTWDEMIGFLAHAGFKHLPPDIQRRETLYTMEPIKPEPAPLPL